MRRSRLLNPLLIGIGVFLLLVFFFHVIDSPRPVSTGLVVSFIAFELSVLYRFIERRESIKTTHRLWNFEQKIFSQD